MALANQHIEYFRLMSALKNLYNDYFYDAFISVFQKVHPAFDAKKFKKEIYAGDWETLELKQRMRKSADMLAKQLPKEFTEAVKFLISFSEKWRGGFGLELMFVLDYVERYGIHDVETSIIAMEKITVISSAEFAIRPFLTKYPERMHAQMYVWSKHKNEHVRRLSSEGFRPRLPWGLAVPHLKKSPLAILPVLETLKHDTSEYVRRSVANNLNDISKDHPEVSIEIFTRWKNDHPETERIVKHASRGLLKKGHPQVLALFGAGNTKGISFTQTKVLKKKIKVGEAQTFAFDIEYSGKKEQKIRLEYVIYYLLKNGQHGRKVFYMSEKMLAPNSKISMEKSHSFRPITTRTYYEGVQKMAVLVNGKEFEIGEFYLVFSA